MHHLAVRKIYQLYINPRAVTFFENKMSSEFQKIWLLSIIKVISKGLNIEGPWWSIAMKNALTSTSRNWQDFQVNERGRGWGAWGEVECVYPFMWICVEAEMLYSCHKCSLRKTEIQTV